MEIDQDGSAGQSREKMGKEKRKKENENEIWVKSGWDK
jgi:hypothetical protein